MLVPSQILSFGLNQDNTCIAAATTKGFRIFRCEPFSLEYCKEEGGMGVVEMLNRSLRKRTGNQLLYTHEMSDLADRRAEHFLFLVSASLFDAFESPDDKVSAKPNVLFTELRIALNLTVHVVVVHGFQRRQVVREAGVGQVGAAQRDEPQPPPVRRRLVGGAPRRKEGWAECWSARRRNAPGFKEQAARREFANEVAAADVRLSELESQTAALQSSAVDEEQARVAAPRLPANGPPQRVGSAVAGWAALARLALRALPASLRSTTAVPRPPAS